MESPAPSAAAKVDIDERRGSIDELVPGACVETAGAQPCVRRCVCASRSVQCFVPEVAL